MTAFIFIILVSVSMGSDDGERPVKITIEAETEGQCNAVRNEAIRMMGGARATPAEIAKRIGPCHRLVPVPLPRERR